MSVKKNVARISVWHHEAYRVITNGDPKDGFLTTIALILFFFFKKKCPFISLRWRYFDIATQDIVRER